ncbi:MAG: hypothetical protein ABIO55_06910 [Ginsengibacter sp.]
MRGNKRYNFKKVLEVTVWILVGMGTMLLLGAAVYKKNNDHCKAVKITIEGVKNNFFIDKADVNTMLEKMKFGQLKFKPLNTFDLTGMEAILEKNVWIKSAELYFDNNDVLRIKIIEREPIARIFNTAGSSFYIDSSLKKLPLSDKFSAMLPMFTNFPFAVNSCSKPDSELLADIKNISTYITRDPFWMAQIEQVDIKPGGTFEIIPNIGNQVILFGSAENYKEKFNNLLIFYKNVQSKVGWNKYAAINVSYKNQVVAVKRGAGDTKLDSLRTIQLIKMLVANAQKQANDSTNNIQLVQPKEDNSVPFAQPHDEIFIDEQPVFNDTISSKKIKPIAPVPTDKNVSKAATPADKNSNPQFSNIKIKSIEKPNPLPLKTAKPIMKRQVIDTNKHPKAVMQPKNDY